MAEPIQPGQTLGKYRLTEKLGEGGMGVVFAGVHEALGREVAVKVLRAEYARNQQLVPRFRREAEAVSRIGHANIVSVYDFGQLDDGSLYYVMERVHGETLGGRMRRALIEREEAVAIYRQLCRALAATHAQKVVHRDLKPENVLLHPQPPGFPHTKILDFGIAKMLEEEAADGSAKLTKVGTLMGTPAYMSPEQIATCHLVDGRADLYSLGAMLYELLAGQPPFGYGEPMAIIAKTMMEKPAPPSAAGKRPVPPALDAMVLRALAKKPDERPPTAAAFIAELEAAWPSERRDPSRQIERPPAAAPAALAPSREPAGARRPLGARQLVGAAGALLAVGAVALLALRPSTHPPAPEPTSAPAPSGLGARAEAVLAGAMSGSPAARRAVMEALADVGDHRALVEVTRGLEDDNPEVRRAAAAAAAAVGTPDDVALKAALAEAAQRSGGAVSVDLAVARYHLGDSAGAAQLQRALELSDPVLRLRAAVALADAKQLPPAGLRAAIVAAPPSVRRALRWHAYLRLYQAGDAAFTAELQHALTGRNPGARLDAAQTLARAGDQDGMQALVELAARAPDPIDRVDAAAVLAELGDAGSVGALRGALTAPLPTVRARAALSLGRLAPLLPHPDAVAAAIAPLLDDVDPATRVAGAAAMRTLLSARKP